MVTVREATFDLLRSHGMTTIFGNPGSTELPMLSMFPSDFTYVLGLQELVVVGIADGYAQATGRPTLVNLHTAPGVGNAVGGIVNAQANKSPLVITGRRSRCLGSFAHQCLGAMVGPFVPSCLAWGRRGWKSAGCPRLRPAREGCHAPW